MNHRRRQGARRVLLWAATAFLLIELGIGLALDYLAPEIRFPACAHLMKLARSSGERVDVVALGSSRLGLAFDASTSGQRLRAALPSSGTVFNACMFVGDLHTSDFLLQRLLAEGCRPKVVVLEVLPTTLSRYNEWLAHDVRQYFRWHELPTYLHDIVTSRTVGALLLSRLVPGVLHRVDLLHALLPPLQRAVPHEWDEADVDATGDCQGLFGPTLARLRGRRSIEVHSPDQDRQQCRRWLARFEIGGASVSAFERILCRCRQHGIQVILVQPPLASNLRCLHSPEVERQFQEYLAHLGRSYDCICLDLRGEVPDGDFLDNQHVAPAGTERVTAAVTAALVPLLTKTLSGGRPISFPYP